jgi:hypothetical protein
MEGVRRRRRGLRKLEREKKQLTLNLSPRYTLGRKGPFSA